ncbi:SWIM zinc finger family protein [Streptomyces sp. NPDC046759]|uniref:SWIM zinc finger family protein n=1 Tax=Streptomyces sp. NPDC046759 TaxID=3155019 RepID=UPI0033CBC124
MDATHLPPEDTAAAAAARPGDAAREALRAARARTDAERAQAPGPAPDAPGTAEETAPDSAAREPASPAGPAAEHPAPTEPRPGDAARAALRTTAAVAPARTETPAPTARPGAAPTARPGAAPGGRPADVAREALRAARRESLRAEAEADEDATRGERHKEPRTRRGPRPAGGSGPTAPRTAPVPAPDARAARSKAAQDMRHYLANAFRMPAWSDTPEEEPPSADGSGEAAEHGERDRAAVPAPPHLPATMATPHRDTELRRTFPAFTPRASGTGGAPFAETWWGNAWVEALEQGALDPKRLARGRDYADQGHVDAITVTPGLVLAYVRGSRPRPYRVQVRVRTLDDEDWARLLDAAADRPGHIAALLDKELPQSLADCGVPLLPGPGDLVPRCSCPDSGHPCKHAAALCYQTARLLDADPFVLLLLRGRGERDLLDALSRRSAARAALAARQRQPHSLPGVRATDALAPRELPPLPSPLPAPPHPEQPPVYPAAPGGPDPFALDQLATDAAARAHALLGTGRDPVGGLTLWQDAVRLAAARPGSGLTATTRGLYATLAEAVGRTPAELARAVAAWRQGGLDGLAVLEEPWDPPAGRFDRARPLLLAADLPAFRPWRNRLTHPGGHVQLRFGRDGLWYAYESEPDQDDWWPRGTPDLDPVGALTGLGTPDDL